jgi:aminoglycoside/choline kinase family phosphotransferase
MLPIADTPAGLEPGWLTEALRAGGVLGAETVTAVQLTPVGTGQMCDSARLALQFDRPTDAPATIVAKLPAADPTSRATALSLRSYEIEVRFYQQLASELPISTPTIYYADIDVETASFVLLMQDLAPAQQGDQLAGCTRSEAEAALDELVNLHAPRWGDAALADLEWLHRDPETSKLMALAMLPMLWQGFVERYADRLGDDVHEAGGALFGNLERFVTAPSEPHTVVHGDYRLDNLLFAAEGERRSVAVVDWQTCAHGPAMSDVAYFIGAGLLAEERREHERELVERYHRALTAAGVTDYPWEQCWTDHRRGTWAGLIMAVGASMLVERTERGDEMFMAMAHRHARHALDLDAPALLLA